MGTPWPLVKAAREAYRCTKHQRNARSPSLLPDHELLEGPGTVPGVWRALSK